MPTIFDFGGSKKKKHKHKFKHSFDNRYGSSPSLSSASSFAGKRPTIDRRLLTELVLLARRPTRASACWWRWRLWGEGGATEWGRQRVPLATQSRTRAPPAPRTSAAGYDRHNRHVKNTHRCRTLQLLAQTVSISKYRGATWYRYRTFKVSKY